MKKILFSLGGVITSFAAVPFVAASCSKESEQKERKVVVADLNDKSKKVGDKVDKHDKVTYQDLSESINLDGITVDIDWSMFKSGNFIVSKYKKEGSIGQIFISTYNGKTTIHGKSNTNKPFEGVLLGTITGLPKNFAITNAENPIYKEGKSSGFIDLFKEGDKIKFKFRFHKYNGKGTDPNISTQVFEATIE
ncbi:P30, predicted lipoprotein [Mycoplasmopsis bovigenitalium 51080]|uniref:p30, predicted lipoprotein n=1 Tax=Mycoplasmopsis bovigenitalium 51080 TaxID=1188235 RepID=N9VFN8_9BACT|nr:variable surface lipoprotein [Mycoplasmopsis bovigenitalium]ENY70181.1 P30, predicted lipoprotein [Mycoplasmopsis bovigenitalium 51080]